MQVSPAGKTSQDVSSSALFSCHEVWFAHVRSIVNNISNSALHKSVCIIATLLGIKLLTNSNKFIHIVTLRHNSLNMYENETNISTDYKVTTSNATNNDYVEADGFLKTVKTKSNCEAQ